MKISSGRLRMTTEKKRNTSTSGRKCNEEARTPPLHPVHFFTFIISIIYSFYSIVQSIHFSFLFHRWTSESTYKSTSKSPNQFNSKMFNLNKTSDRNCSEIDPKLLWNCSEIALKLLWSCSGIALELLSNSFKINSKLLWNCSEIALKLLWNCSEVALELL